MSEDGNEVIRSYRDLRVWQAGMAIAEECYRLTTVFPRTEVFGLTSQIRRAASAVPANIAEGYGRGRSGDYMRFLSIARGSLKELETHLLLACRVGLTAEASVTDLLAACDDAGRMLGGLIRSLEQARP